MACELRICGTEPESIVDGEGIRFVVLVQGCPHHCPGCHNPGSHAFDGGTVIGIEALYSEICGNPLLKGVTFSGGEPFCQPEPLSELARMVHAKGLDVTTYTGYLYEDLLHIQDQGVAALLSQTDVLIDGPFILAEKDLTLAFRGSRNQRIIDLKSERQK